MSSAIPIERSSAVPVVGVVAGGPVFLQRLILLDDTSSMFDCDHLDWRQDADVRHLLETYVNLHEAARKQQPEFDGWLPRVKSLDGVEDRELPSLHGKLIALGFLKFQLVNRTSGMHYHVDASGRQALAHPDGIIADFQTTDDVEVEEEGDSLAAA